MVINGYGPIIFVVFPIDRVSSIDGGRSRPGLPTELSTQFLDHLTRHVSDRPYESQTRQVTRHAQVSFWVMVQLSCQVLIRRTDAQALRAC